VVAVRAIGIALVAIGGLVAIGMWKCPGERAPPADAKHAPVIDAKPQPQPTTTLVLKVTDKGHPIPARIALSKDGAPVRIGTLDVYGQRQGGAACELAPWVIGTWDGLVIGRGVVEIPIGLDSCTPSPAIPYGRYDVLAWRGIEYEAWRGTVDLSAKRGRVELEIPLERAWTPHGTLAADLHVHAKASDDSNMPNPQRVIAQVASGIQVIGLSDHNSAGDVADDIAALGYGNLVASIPSNELSNDTLHAGIYPALVQKDQRGGGSPSTEVLNQQTVSQFFATARRLAGTGVVQLNHPRLRSTALFDYYTWDGVTWPPPWPMAFDAVEVIAGHTAFNIANDRRLDDSVRDYFTMVDHNFLVAPLGNSDTHDFNWIHDGTARNYVYVDDPKTKPFDQSAFIKAIKRRRVVATSGPWLDVEVSANKGGPTVGPGEHLVAQGSVWLDITVAHAKFVEVERVRVLVGGPKGPQLGIALDIPANQRTFHWTGRVALPGTKDTWVAVTADGDTPMPAEITGSYHVEHKRGVTPYALASPILVDVDGDGHWQRAGIDRVLD
jgi:hypothetical protein